VILGLTWGHWPERERISARVEWQNPVRSWICLTVNPSLNILRACSFSLMPQFSFLGKLPLPLIRHYANVKQRDKLALDINQLQNRVFPACDFISFHMFLLDFRGGRV